MATTRYILVEQASKRLLGGYRSVAAKISWGELQKAVEQEINALLRPQQFEAMQAGESLPQNNVLCSYTVPVVAWNNISKSILPAIPVSLPKGMGVYHISKTGDPFASEFIPAGMGQLGNALVQRGLSTILNQVAYEVRGKEVWYNVDLTAQSPPTTSVMMQLVVMDFTQFTDYDIIPINSDLEAQVVDNVVKRFAGEPTNPQAVNDETNTK